MNRKRLVDLMLGELNEKSSNTEVITHVESILDIVMDIHQEVVRLSLSSLNADIDSRLSSTVDVSKAITYISRGDYFNALKSLSYYLLSSKNSLSNLNLLETFSIYSTLSGMLSTEMSMSRLVVCV